MLTTLVATAQRIDFASLRTEPFTSVTHFKVYPGTLRSMRITNWGERVTVLRSRLNSNFYDDSVVAARYVVGELVRQDHASSDGWSAIPSAADPSRSIVSVAVLVDSSQGQAPYGRSWVKGGVDPEKFLREILSGLR